MAAGSTGKPKLRGHTSKREPLTIVVCDDQGRVIFARTFKV